MTFIHALGNRLVSVLMPVRNSAHTLKTAMESLLSQTYRNMEVIAVDHTSDDASWDILREYAARDPRVRAFRFTGKSFVECLNFGLGFCGGEYVARMDADDVCRERRIEKQVRFLEEEKSISIAGTLVAITGKEVGEGYRRYERWINSIVKPEDVARNIFIESPIPHPTAMMRREVIEELGGYGDNGWPEDYDLWLRAHMKGMRMAKVPEHLLEWKDHPERASRNSNRYSRRNFHRVRAHYLSLMLAAKKVVIQGAGPTGKTLGKLLREKGVAIEAFIDINPRRVGETKLGLPVFAAGDLGFFQGRVLLSAVSSWGARDIIRKLAADAGFMEGVDFFCAS